MTSATAGRGRICLALHGSDAIFSELSSTYPLKLLSPRNERAGFAVVYMITYGGGLVSGDSVSLSVDVGPRANLVLLSQGSTKVFKFRPGQRAASTDALQVTTQRMEFSVASGGALFLLPDPVTCFRAASYNQLQTFHLAPDASLVLLDWVTSGRKSRGEDWVFARYYSVNEVLVGGRRVAKDVMLLENEDGDASGLPVRTLASKLAPYACYATLLLYGPQVQGVISALTEEYGRISVFKTGGPAGLLWSLSAVEDGGAVVRVAGDESEGVRRWLGEALGGLEMVVGLEIFRRAFG
ncbi:UreD urease accessory protein-domain-containing protein [Mycena alexandri]|uniref:UreD urease accessory protein-domain-containing protein n=1 Tax=Mycena alexandri TaxID=1745969 RepID=A0AAD6T329_9AGAR|nr:UreD urease accessory protein-domain-containing protein [Mycena alexandri]